MSGVRVALAALVMIALPSLVHAQARPDTARPRRYDSRTVEARPLPPEMLREQMEMMGPMMGQMMSTMVSTMLDALAQPENTQRMATFTKNYFDALMGKGFTRDEAFRIVLAHGV